MSVVKNVFHHIYIYNFVFFPYRQVLYNGVIGFCHKVTLTWCFLWSCKLGLAHKLIGLSHKLFGLSHKLFVSSHKLEPNYIYIVFLRFVKSIEIFYLGVPPAIAFFNKLGIFILDLFNHMGHEVLDKPWLFFLDDHQDF